MIEIPPGTAVCKARNGVGPEPSTAQVSQTIFPIPARVLTSRRRIFFKILLGGFRPLGPPIKTFPSSNFAKCLNSWQQTMMTGVNNDVEMDGGSVKDGDMDARLSANINLA
ncbi:MAG: hypothetical protein ACLQQ0_04860 [Limisphaerales bacterium]